MQGSRRTAAASTQIPVQRLAVSTQSTRCTAGNTIVRVRHETRFCTSFHGIGLAYAIDGEGPPLVKASTVAVGTSFGTLRTSGARSRSFSPPSFTTKVGDLQVILRLRDPESNRGHHDFQTSPIDRRRRECPAKRASSQYPLNRRISLVPAISRAFRPRGQRRGPRCSAGAVIANEGAAPSAAGASHDHPQWMMPEPSWSVTLG
jgi:hypothetical protein